MNKRLEVIDALRGFSLLGIIIANMLYFQYSSNTKDMIDLNTWWDQGAYYFTKILNTSSDKYARLELGILEARCGNVELARDYFRFLIY